MFRSEKLNYYKIVAPSENGRDIIIRLGEKRRIHLVDLNQQEQIIKKFYHPQIKQIDEIVTLLHHIHKLVTDSRNDGAVPCANDEIMEEHLNKIDHLVFTGGMNDKTYLDYLEGKAQQTLRSLKGHTDAKDHLLEMIHRSEEELMVLRILKLQLPDSFK
jgi:hypothetical protein